MFAKDTQFTGLSAIQKAAIALAFEKSRGASQRQTTASADVEIKPTPTPLGILEGVVHMETERPETAASAEPFAQPGAATDHASAAVNAGRDTNEPPPNSSVLEAVGIRAMGLPVVSSLLARQRPELLDLLAYSLGGKVGPSAPDCRSYDVSESYLAKIVPGSNKKIAGQVMQHFLWNAVLESFSASEYPPIADEIATIQNRLAISGDTLAYVKQHLELIDRLRESLPATLKLPYLASRSEFCRIATALPLRSKFPLLKYAFDGAIPHSMRDSHDALMQALKEIPGADEQSIRTAVSNVLWTDFFASLSETKKVEIGSAMHAFQAKLAQDGDFTAYAGHVRALVDGMEDAAGNESLTVARHDLLAPEEIAQLREHLESFPHPGQVLQALMTAVDRRVLAKWQDQHPCAAAGDGKSKEQQLEILAANRSFFRAQMGQIFDRLAAPPAAGPDAVKALLARSRQLADELLHKLTDPSRTTPHHKTLRLCAFEQPGSVAHCAAILDRSPVALGVQLAVAKNIPVSDRIKAQLDAFCTLACELLLTPESREAMRAAVAELPLRTMRAAEASAAHPAGATGVNPALWENNPPTLLWRNDGETDPSTQRIMGQRPLTDFGPDLPVPLFQPSRATLSVPRYEEAAKWLDRQATSTNGIYQPACSPQQYATNLRALTAVMEAELAHPVQGAGTFSPQAFVRQSQHPDVVAAGPYLASLFIGWA